MRHIIIPDTQVKPGVDIGYLAWVGEHIVERRPDVVVHLGDHWDFPSLSSYDKKSGRSFEGRRVVDDIDIGNDAMSLLLGALYQCEDYLKGRWKPRLVFTMGNHEDRLQRAINDNPHELEGVLGYHLLDLEDWEVHPYLKPVVIDGVAYCHFFVSGVMGRPVASAKALLQKQHMSCVMGHVQDRDIAFDKRADGQQMTALFAGICYDHDEDYLNPQTNGSWSGIWEFNEVEDGSFNEMAIPLSWLEERYS